MANTAKAGSSSGSFQEVDLEQLVHLRAKNALWRSWSIEGLSEAAGEEAVNVGVRDGRRPSAKSSPKAWEVLYERFLLDVGDSSLAMELSRRHAGAQDIMTTGGGGTNVGRRRSTAAAAAMSENTGGAEEAAVRGGQLFGHLAGKGGGNSTGSGGYASADDSEIFFQEGISREDSGWSELAFGLELSGSYDQHHHQRSRLRSTSVGSVEKASTPLWTRGPINARLSDPTLGEGEGLEGNPTPDRMNLLRKTFTQARNQRLRDVPDDSVSAFLGDELSVHHNNYFGSSWGGRSSSNGSGGGGGGGSAGVWGGASFDVPAAAGGAGLVQWSRARGGGRQPPDCWADVGGASGALFGRSRNVLSLGNLQGAAMAAAATAAAAAAAEESVSAPPPSSPPRKREVVTAAAAAAAAAGRAAAAEEPTVSAHRPPAGQARSATGAAAPPAESSGGASRRDGGSSSSSSSVVGGAQQRQHEDDQEEEKQQKARGSETTPRQPPAAVDAVGEWGAASRSNLRPMPADSSSKGIGMGGGGIGARSTSALLDKLAHEQDRGQAVMMPLMDWDDWTPDRLHWTYPAVVHAFPRCLYEAASTTATRHRRQGTRRNRCRSDGAPAMPPVAAGEGARESRGRASGVPLPQGGDGKQDGPDEEASPWGAAVVDRETEVAAAATAAANPPSPFEPLSLGEVYIRTAPASDLAPVGVGAGPWRRRWLVLRQTYMFELLEPPSPPVPTLVLASGQAGAQPQPQPQPQPPPLSDAVAVDDTAAFFGSLGDEGGAAPVEQGGGSLEDEVGRGKVRKLDQEQPQQWLPGEMGPPPPPPPARDEGREGNDDGGAQKYVAPVGFVCLSKASVEDGGINWGPKTLLLRCQARPADISREEASAAAVIGGGGGDDVIGGSASVRARRRVGTKICVELRVPSPEVGERWAALFRERAALEMASLFEPSPPDFEDNAKAGGSSDSGSGDHHSGGGDGDGGGGGFSGGAEGAVETDTGFSVLGTGRFSRVVWARRKRPWARAGGSVSAIKIVNKQAFWSRVRVGKERVDTLAREVFCQTTLTIKGADAASGAAAGGDPSSEESSEERSEERSEDRASRGAGGAGAVVACDGAGGGGIVRIHSIFETADDLILEMDLMSRTDLFDRLLERDGAFSEREAAGLTLNLLRAIDKCNRLGFCHRDVKLSNLLYPGPASTHGPECVLLADFGMATTAGRDGLVRGRCGTSGYVAPEILKAGKQEGYGMNVDIFSAGVVLYICLCGFEPFFGVTEKDVIAANKEAVFEFPPEAWDDVSEGAKDLIRQMMEPDPARRITPHEALRHSWIVQHRTSLH